MLLGGGGWRLRGGVRVRVACAVEVLDFGGWGDGWRVVGDGCCTRSDTGCSLFVYTLYDLIDSA